MKRLVLVLLAACGGGSSDPCEGVTGACVAVESGASYDEIQTALIEVPSGGTVAFAAGTYRIDTDLSLDVDGVTVKGAGMDKTILSFAKQTTGAQGMLVTADDFVIHDIAFEDAPGDALKVLGAKSVTIRKVRVEWTNGPAETNGAYGLYPVQCERVLIEDSVVIGASDAGVYVGQSKDIVVRGNRAEKNVAGIEIENSSRADVYNNTATHNTGGILVFNLPDLAVKNGSGTRVHDNTLVDNNTENFAPAGNIVGKVPTGTGIALLAAHDVEIFQNTIADHLSINIGVISYVPTDIPVSDATYDQYPTKIYIHDNTLTGVSDTPTGELGALLISALGEIRPNGPYIVPDVAWDGVVDPARTPGDPNDKICIRNNGDADFINLAWPLFDANKPAMAMGPHDCSHPALPRGELVKRALLVLVAACGGSSEVCVLDGKFCDKLSSYPMLDDAIAYRVNTPLFSDYTTKERAIYLPPGTAMTWSDRDAFVLPVGAAVIKHFSYPSKPLETRLLVRTPTGWTGASYVAEGDDAKLALAGAQIDVEWGRYAVPNKNQCKNCHAEHDDAIDVIGPKARHLNDGEQLERFVAEGLLVGAPAHETWPRAPNASDPSTGSLDARARAWLDINCAYCHNSNGGAARTSGLYLDLEQPAPGVCKPPIAAGRGSGGRAYAIVPGQPDASFLVYRLESTEPEIKMPELGRNLVDAEGVALIREWITAMPGSCE